MITQRSKAYYLSPTYTMIFAPGALMVERLIDRAGRTWLGPLVLAALILSGLALAPLAKPVLPVDRWLRSR